MEKTKNAKNKKIIFTNKTKQYVEGLVYILAIVVVIFANNYGNIYIRMLPLLFILGVVGKLIFDRPVITTIFGMITSICIVKLSGQNNFMSNLFISLCASLHIALGELFGQYAQMSYKYIKKKKKIKNKGVLSTYIITVCVLIISILIYDFTNGNLYRYSTSRATLNKYLKDTYYDTNNFKIVDVHYEFYKERSYVFEVRDKSKQLTSRFIVYWDKSKYVYDEYKLTVLEKNNIKLKQDFSAFIKEIKNTSGLDITPEYYDIDSIKLNIFKDCTIINNDEKVKFAKDTLEVIKSISSFNEFNKIKEVSLILNNTYDAKESLMSIVDIDNINEKLQEGSEVAIQYILKSLNVEFID